MLAALSLSTAAALADAGEWTLDAGPGFRGLWVGGFRAGAGVELGATRGLDEAWSWRAAVAAARLGEDDREPAGSLSLTAASLGAIYAVDTLRAIPFAEVGLDAALFVDHGAATAVTFFGGHAGAGVAYHLSPRWQAILAARLTVLPLNRAGTEAETSLLLAADLRLGYRLPLLR